MSRPVHVNIASGTNGWDGRMDDNFDVIHDAPFPAREHVGTESDLESAFPAASHDRCLIWVNHSTHGFVLYFSNGTAWEILSELIRLFTNVSGVGTLAVTDRVVLASGNGYTITMAAEASMVGRTVTVKRTATGSAITLAGNSGTIDGGTFSLAAQFNHASLYCDGTNWHVIAQG